MSRDSWAWLLGVTVVVLNAGLGSINVDRMQNTERQLHHARDIEFEFRGLLTDMVDAETGYRGYLLTNNPAYLEPYARAESSFSERIALLREMTSGLPSQQRRIGEAEQLAREKFDVMKRTMDKRETLGLAAAAEEMRTSRSKAIMDELRVVIAAALAREEDLIALEETEAKARYKTAIFTNIAGACIAIGIVLVAIVSVRSELERRLRVNQALKLEQEKTETAFGLVRESENRYRNLASTLEQSVQERTAALNDQRAFLDAILNSSREGIVACDAQGRLLFNRAGKELYGLPPEYTPSENWSRHHGLYEAGSLAPLLPNDAPLTRTWKGEVLEDLEMIIRSDNGTERFVLCSGRPLINAAGATFGAVVSLRDITDRRAYEVQLLQTTRLLESSNEELEKFAYIASHDLQEPLRKIQAFGDRLVKRQRARLDEEGQESVDRMLDAAGRMRRLIEDLLAFSRVSTKKVLTEPVDLNTVLDDVASVFEMRLKADGGRLSIDRLPTVSGDESQLRQLFQNLIGNALKFAKPGELPVVTITSTKFANLPEDADPPRPEGEGWRIIIKDSGIGFEQQYADRIFELFQRLHGRAAYEGTGLGLAICKKIVHRHGATITARSQSGQGAAFIIDWPIPVGSV